MMNVIIMNGDICSFSEFAMRCPGKMLKPNPHLLNGWHVIPFANGHLEPASTVDGYISYMHGLMMSVLVASDII